MIDRKVVDRYLQIIGEKRIDTKRFEVVDIADEFPVDRINGILNK